MVEIFKGSIPPSVPTLTIEIPAITLRIEYDKKISIVTVVSIVLEIARILLKQILEQINEILVEEYWGRCTREIKCKEMDTGKERL
ncbi:hypothetical protein DRP04_12285 [Archaeoglobales archaeon]|nr:MAG: hypothetical protein DRP04_12285 [Archaeoglobales archaeon]